MKIIHNEKLNLNMFEIDYLKWWFDEEYLKEEQKLRRLHTLKLLTDDNKDPFNELIKLYNQAEEYRKRIQFLEEHDE